MATAENTPIPDHSVDLVTVAQAAHWFDPDAFHDEVRRVARGNAVLAVWGYGLATVSPGVDSVIGHFYREVTGPYWPPERSHLDAGYRTLHFPFPQIDAPAFEIWKRWSLGDLLGYLSTWSAVQACREQTGLDPVPRLEEALGREWGDPGVEREVVWPMFLKLGRVRPG